jgi:DNA-binding response OmpR family regulator
LMSGTWLDILENIKHLPNTPSLIVTSRLADERLWAEVLNLGAWDVLAKPFDRSEVICSMRSAWLHSSHQVQVPAHVDKGNDSGKLSQDDTRSKPMAGFQSTIPLCFGDDEYGKVDSTVHNHI